MLYFEMHEMLFLTNSKNWKFPKKGKSQQQQKRKLQTAFVMEADLQRIAHW